jgi:hypothetical protein
MNEPPPGQESKKHPDRSDDWKIQFIGRSENLAGDLFRMIFLFFLAGFVLVLGIRELLLGVEYLIAVLCIIVSIVLILFGLSYVPWNPMIIEKTGDDFVFTVVRANMGISDASTWISLSDIKGWQYSEKDKTLSIRTAGLPSHPYDNKENVRDDWEKFTLNGISDKDLSFLLDWLGRNFTRGPPMDDD